ncbi:hypothetical protein AB2B38_009030 [Balneola sp. MJW-20]|uniref:hypothetical protein n=1 Tax=Gracilimonas aurantiaca TaxID=3234185 RepID=UPI0034667ACB
MEIKLKLDIEQLSGGTYLVSSSKDKDLKAEGRSIAEAIEMILSMEQAAEGSDLSIN